MPPLDHPLWQFSLQIYTLPGVASRCVQLQDEFGLNVNVLLAAVWVASLGRSLSPNALVTLQEAIAPLDQSTTQPLRSLRRRVSQDETLPQDWRVELKQRLLAAELYAEQMEQALLYQALDHLGLDTEALPSEQERTVLLRRNLQVCGAIAATPAAGLEESLERLAALCEVDVV